MAKPTYSFSGKQLIMLAVAAFGYYVDLYDLLIVGSERMETLQAMGVTGSNGKDVWIMIQNWQLVGMIAGGFVFGIAADKIGRLRILFFSILL